ncbi:MAG: hypothetical protein GXY83_41195 [Rhodopirellula sp.]|nr:hypothetical protein [Rhodopirellula sp.]
MRLTSPTCAILLAFAAASLALGDGDRLTHLDEFSDPYYVGLDTAKLVTPQWIGEEGVEAAIILSIDDMRDSAPYEAFLRPILQRLKAIDGRAPASIMAPRVDPGDPQLAKWFAEGVSVEAHTLDHPCPCLQKNDFAKAKATYDGCIDLLTTIPNYRPVAFRMPCCDSMNSMSPRFYSEVFNKTTPQGNFLQMNSSVFMVFTPKDPSLPLEAVIDEEGRRRFDKYVPLDRNFVNYVEDYPYPYVVAGLCWEMPSAIPDDWLGFNAFGPHGATTVRDMKAAIDATVIKKGVFTLTFHPGRWIRNDQVIELIDHAVARYGGKVKFLSFQDVQQKLTDNLLAGQPLRAKNGQDNGVRVADFNGDGYMDVAIGNEHLRQTRVWSPEKGTWTVSDFPTPLVTVDPRGSRSHAGARFGVLRQGGMASLLVRNETVAGLWHFDGRSWIADPKGLTGLEADTPLFTSQGGCDRGVRLRDLDGDGICELIVGNEAQQAVFSRSADAQAWRRLPLTLPPGATIVDARGRDAGLRFVDIDGDLRDDVVFSNAQRYDICLYRSLAEGWSRRYLSGQREEGSPIPMIVRGDGTNNGAWFKGGHMYVQNENTGAALPNHVDFRSYTGFLRVAK